MLKLFKNMKMDLELKGYSPKTIDAYLLYAKRFVQFHQKPIEQLHTDEIRNYLHYLIVTKKCSHSYVNVNYSALKFLYKNVLNKHWKEFKHKHWLFPGIPSSKAISERTIQRAFKNSLHKTNISKNATVHTLRHCFATHLLEAGVDVFHIQKLLGHASPKTTARYIHLTRKDILDVKSPFDMMDSDHND